MVMATVCLANLLQVKDGGLGVDFVRGEVSKETIQLLHLVLHVRNELLIPDQ